jgi:alpha-methylacyl-CoA racemase
MLPLIGIRVLTLATNLPGPLACQRLTQLGASVTNVEPPAGDPVARQYAEFHRKLHRDQKIITLDLKSDTGRNELHKLLVHTDLLLTSSRPRALTRLGLGWDELHGHFPRLCQVAIVGYPAPDEDRPGHDLTYQAAAGLVEPPQLPRVLVADCAGAERAVSAALGLLLQRERAGEAGYAAVALSEAAAPYAESIRHLATSVGGPLRGGSPFYGVYATRSGWIALAALENEFIESLKKNLDLPEIKKKSLETIFLTRTAKEWEDWGRQHDIPIAVVVNLET